MNRSESRIPPPVVDPVRSDGIRFEQVTNGLQTGLDQMGGYLAAYDVDQGMRLWMLKVYDNLRRPDREGDVQDVFFRSMKLEIDGRLLIENERGERFLVDPDSRSVEPAR
ncbi:MAG: hypothetical protein GEU90_13625 [Gemmatimonas sp.]|nr:hypothetical protein [Gemmatimonas sp.]